RHHGPGCARSLLGALTALQPDILLVEGPPDAAEVLPLIAHEEIVPPVALLVYAPDAPRQAAFYPFASFSPEWQALRFAFAQHIPARFIDLPQAMRLTPDSAVAATTPEAEAPLAAEGTGDDEQHGEGSAMTAALRDDPIGILAGAAGYADHELWWEQQVERRTDPTDLFAGIAEAMAALRADAPPPEGEEARREAHMRQAIRAAQRERFARIAVVCGAWHAPVLIGHSTAKADAALLAGQKRTKVAATWVPWTNSRLAYRSGYGAGVQSPGWYSHLWSLPDRHAIHWIARAAAALRDEDLDAPSSNVIEAVRLADTLAALRDLPLPGLDELREAIQTTLCGGDPAPMALIRDRLEIGEALGSIPAETPAVPLQRDLELAQRRLRLRPSAEIKPLNLDLRQPLDRERSHTLHRLAVLGIQWATLQGQGGAKSTFNETWSLGWRPELAIAVIEASAWGNTIAAAADAKLRQQGEATNDLAELTALLDAAILAALPATVAGVLARVRTVAAVAADVRGLMDALPPLARVARYGDVRETRAEDVLPIIDGLLARIVVGLPGACSTLDDDAAQRMIASIDRAQESIALLDRQEGRSDWYSVLGVIAEREIIHGLVRGRAARILLDERVIDEVALGKIARLALAAATPTPDAAAWIAGVVYGNGLVLLQQGALWLALDGWLRELAPDQFVAVLPLVRRAFSAFAPPERRAMGDKVKRLAIGGASAAGVNADALLGLDRDRADRVLPILARLLGVAPPQR
ncbi:MAG TPA: DUF5682 family protein, partial [Thermomicrobiales bacterium]